MADEIALHGWVVSASLTPEGGISLAVSHDGAPRATLTVPAPAGSGAAEGASSRTVDEDLERKLEQDMDF